MLVLSAVLTNEGPALSYGATKHPVISMKFVGADSYFYRRWSLDWILLYIDGLWSFAYSRISICSQKCLKNICCIMVFRHSRTWRFARFRSFVIVMTIRSTIYKGDQLYVRYRYKIDHYQSEYERLGRNLVIFALRWKLVANKHYDDSTYVLEKRSENELMDRTAYNKI